MRLVNSLGRRKILLILAVIVAFSTVLLFAKLWGERLQVLWMRLVQKLMVIDGRK